MARSLSSTSTHTHTPTHTRAHTHNHTHTCKQPIPKGICIEACCPADMSQCLDSISRSKVESFNANSSHTHPCVSCTHTTPHITNTMIPPPSVYVYVYVLCVCVCVDEWMMRRGKGPPLELFLHQLQSTAAVRRFVLRFISLFWKTRK